jgi:hypothetical protein
MPRKAAQNKIIAPYSYKSNKLSVPSYNPPKVIQPSPPSYPSSVPVAQPGFLSNVMQGFAWGTGTTIARNIFESHPTMPSPTIAESTPNKVELSCNSYNLCKQLNDPYDCYSKLDQKEYEFCKSH